jgi:ketosteroid isomerase-like protein
MSVAEIHTSVFGRTGIASGLLSAKGKRSGGTVFRRKGGFLGALVKHDGKWQLVAPSQRRSNRRNPPELMGKNDE